MSVKAVKAGKPPEQRGTIGITTAKSRRANDIRDVFAENYLDYQYRFVEFFVEHLEDVSRAFRGDLQQMLVLAIVGQVALRTVRAEGVTPTPASHARSGISASRIADVTAIPRQTVRRKLDLLRQKGWVEQLPDNSWTICHHNGTSVARVDLNEVDQRAIERIARLFTDLEALVNKRS